MRASPDKWTTVQPGPARARLSRPPQAPKAAAGPIRPVVVVDRFDRKLLAAIEGHGDQPAPVWTLVHQIVHDEHPPSRTHRRMLVARLLCRLRGLLRAGRIMRDGEGHLHLREPGKPTPTPAPSLCRTLRHPHQNLQR